MAVNTTWSSPATASGSGGTDLAAGDTLSETVWDRVQSDLYRLGGTDGNAKTGRLQLGSTQTFSATGVTQGLAIDQDGNDDAIVLLKSTGDVAHGMTSQAETAAFADASKIAATSGGVQWRGFSSATIAARLWGFGTTDDTTHTTAGTAYVEAVASKKSGTTQTSPGANANLFAVRDGAAGTTNFIIDQEGDMFNNGASGTSTTYDAEDDGALVETVALLMAPARAKQFKFALAHDLEAHTRALAAGGVITLNADGSLSMLSYKGMLGLLIDAIRQVTHAHRTLEARVAPLLPA